MKSYNYFLFRLYKPLIKNTKDGPKTVDYILTTTSTLVIFFSIFTILLYIDFYCFGILKYILPNKTYVLLLMVLIAVINYFFFVKDKKFLNYNFHEDKKGGFFIIFYLIVMVILFSFIVNNNREQIIKQNLKKENLLRFPIHQKAI